MVGGIGGFIVSVAAALNGNDDLGTFSGTVPANSETDITTVGGGDGSVTLTFKGTTQEFSPTSICAPLPTPTPPSMTLPPIPTATPPSMAPPEDEDPDSGNGGNGMEEYSLRRTFQGPLGATPDSSQLFSPLREAVSLIPSIETEAGNPGDLTEVHIEDIRQTLLRSSLGLAEVIAGAWIEEAHSYQGVAEAIVDFKAAQNAAAAGDAAGAIDLYQAAFDKAAAAIENAADLSAAERLPFQISLTSDFFSTRPGREPAFLVVVLGAAGPVDVSVSGQPSGVTVGAVPAAGDVPVHFINLTLGDVAPGTYTLQLDASDGAQQASRELTLVVNAGPAPTPTPTPIPTPSSGPSTEQVVDERGGDVGVNSGFGEDGGVTVRFPEGALPTEVTVAVSVADQAPEGVDAPSGSTLLNKTIEVTPSEDVNLGEPVTILINLEAGEFEPSSIESIMVGVVTPGGIQVMPTGVIDPVNGIIEVTIDHVTKFTIFVTTRGGPTISTPPPGAQLTELGSPLRWVNPDEGATQFHIQVVPFNADGPGIDLVIGDSALVAAAQYEVLAPSFGSESPNYVMLPGMTYFWRVRTTTVTTPPTEEDWTAWVGRNFKTAPASGDTISVVSPEPEATVADLTPTLTWANADPSVFYYEVQVSKDPEFGSNAFLYSERVHGGVSDTPNSYSIPSQFPLETATIYDWRVRPRIQGDGTLAGWSEAWSFRTP